MFRQMVRLCKVPDGSTHLTAGLKLLRHTTRGDTDFQPGPYAIIRR